jgi:acyl-CoA thioesterase-1
MGDSLSAGYGINPEQSWVSLLQKRLQSEGYEYEVVNASVSGETTEGGLHRLPRALELHHPQIVMLELGANDGLRGLPLAGTRENLEKMIAASRALGATVILMGMRIPPNYGPRYTDEFMKLYTDLAKRDSLAFIPFFLRSVVTDRSLVQADGLHPTAEAQPKLLDTVWPDLKPLLKGKR